MKKLIFILALASLHFLPLNAQNVNVTDMPLNQLDFMIGEWQGNSWMMTRDGKQESHMKEIVQCKQDCKILVVEGIGTKTDEETKETKIVHDAFGVITYDSDSKSYQLRAYKDGNETVSKIEIISDKQIRWNLEVPNGGKVRFTADYTDTTWKEIGEFSRDGGETWMQFLGMDLTKVKN